MKHKFLSALLCLTLVASVFSVFATPVAATDPATTLSVYVQRGTGTATLAHTYTLAELQALGTVTQYYTGIDSLGCIVQGKGTGVLLTTLMTNAHNYDSGLSFASGINIKLYANDNKTKTLTYDYLYGTRYYYPGEYNEVEWDPSANSGAGAWLTGEIMGTTSGAGTTQPMMALVSYQSRSPDPDSSTDPLVEPPVQTQAVLDAATMDNLDSYRLCFGLSSSDLAANGAVVTASSFFKWVYRINVIVPAYTVTAASGITGGTVTSNAPSTGAAAGDTVTLTASPNSGNQLKAGTLIASYNGGQTLTLTPGANNTYSFTMPSYAVSVTAQFETAPLPTYTATFVSDGSTYTTESATSGYSISAPADPAKTGYAFGGWYSDANFTNAVTFPYTLTANVTLYAKWTPTYTATFVSDGSTYTTESATSGSSISAPAAPAKTGYAFGGWYSDSNFTNAVTFPYTLTANVTLYAKWTPIYTATFVSDSSTYTTESAASGSSISAPTAPSKTGYTFGGWYSDANFTNAVTFPYTLTGNVSLYAKWNVISTTYTATFVSDGSTYTTESAASGSSISAPTAPSKTGYIFGGWYSDSNFTNAVTFPYTLTANVTLYAKWIPLWDLNGDHVCNIGDVVKIGLKWGLTGTPGWIPEDVNHDGVINIGDVVVIGLHWGAIW